jgi:D-alanine-D-alanine ligase
MKLLIVNNPSPEKIDSDRQRFAEMSESLAKAGFLVQYHPVKSMQDLKKQITDFSPDLIYSAEYYLPDGIKSLTSVHAYLEDAEIPFVGSSQMILERVIAKSEIKETWKFYNIPTPAFCRITSNLAAGRVLVGFSQNASFPFILKPDKEGNSRGLDESSIVYDKTSLYSKLNEMLNLYDEVLIEEFYGDDPGLREFTVAMIGSEGHRLLMPAEILLKEKKEHRIITTADKELHRTKALPVEDAELHEMLTSFAREAFDVAEVRDYARCDILMKGKKLFALEINGLPMVPDKWFEVCAAGAGLDIDEYLTAIIMAGVVRNIRSGKTPFRMTDEMMRSLPRTVWRTLCEEGAENA